MNVQELIEWLTRQPLDAEVRLGITTCEEDHSIPLDPGQHITDGAKEGKPGSLVIWPNLPAGDYCWYCNGEGEVDSGGFDAMGYPINIPCGCSCHNYTAGSRYL